MSGPGTPVCALCRKSFEPGAAEHILPNAIGWSRATTDIVCPSCNAATSRFDQALIDSVKPLITLIDPPGRRKAAPSFAPAGTALPVTIRPGGEVVLPAEYIFERDGERWVSVEDERWDEFLERMSARGQEIELTEHVTETSIPDAIVPVLDLSPAALPALGKSAIHVAAWQVSDWDRDGSGIAALRDVLVRGGDALPGSGVFSWDFDQPGLDEAPFYHGIQLLSCPQQRAICVRVHVFGLVRVRFVLSETYSGEVHKVLRWTRDPQSGDEQSEETSCPHPFAHLFALRRQDEYPIEAARSYFASNRHSVRPEHWEDKWPDDDSVGVEGADS